MVNATIAPLLKPPLIGRKRTVDLKSHLKIPFPSEFHFAESFDVEGDYIYFPLNHIPERTSSYPSGLYRCSLSQLLQKSISFELVFAFQEIHLLFGSKFKSGIFLSCDSLNEDLVILDTRTNNLKKIKLPSGCPNDVVFDNQDSTIAYVVLAGRFKAYNGILLRVNIETDEQTILFGDFTGALFQKKLYNPTGVNIVGDYIYVATLLNVLVIPKENPSMHHTVIDGTKAGNYPLYDNISVSPSDDTATSLIVAIYDTNQRTIYDSFSNSFLLHIIMVSMSCIFGTTAILDKENFDFGRPPTKTPITFVKMNLNSDHYEAITVNQILPEFDQEFTHIVQLTEKVYIGVNFKANGALLFELV